MPKKLFYLSLISISALMFLGAASVFAVGNYVPLVNIPGAGIPGNLTAYLLGFYNFLLSIVGIIAMVAIVWGGFRYMTSAGNATAMAEAKDIILNAVLGLILALLSYLILTTINPDLLMISKPVSNLANINVPSINRPMFSSCCDGAGCNPDEATGMCTCVDGAKVLPCTTDPDCGPGATCGADAPPKCIQGCADPDCTSPNPSCAGAGDGCVNDCNTTCQDGDPNNYHCLTANALVGKNLNDISYTRITAKVGEKLYLDVSSLSQDFSGKPYNIFRYVVDWNDGLPGSQACYDYGGFVLPCPDPRPPIIFTHAYSSTGIKEVYLEVSEDGPTFLLCSTNASPILPIAVLLGACYVKINLQAVVIDVLP